MRRPLIDLRSDTVTRPTPAMRRAMAEAEVGDDVYGEDPTIARLEERVAAMFGHEAALFVPSGTMGNQLALRLLVPPAEELLCDADAHVVSYEGGGAAQHAGIQTRTLPGGLLDPAQVAAQLRVGYGTVQTRAVSVEQTHNRCGGLVYPLATIETLRELTARAGIALHCDGARIWNAAVASGTPLASYGALFDTMSVCFSKGLGAPVGSALVGSADLVEAARPIRRRLGGGMRQAGILAAAALYALDHHLDRLADDHARAALLAESLPCEPPETNIVVIEVPSAPALASAAAQRGVLIGVLSERRARAVVHLDVDDAAVKTAASVLGDLLAG